MEENKVINNCKVVLIGGSAGSLEVLIRILPGLTGLNGFALVIVLHRKSAEDSTLEELLALKARMPLPEVEDKTILKPGNIYVAPSDYHLLFEKNGLLSLDTSEKINHSRPSIDVSFESAADVYGPGLVGIILSGANGDGTEGLKAIRKADGIIVVQQPDTAEIPYMPQFAIDNTTPDYILDPDGILKLLNNINS